MNAELERVRALILNLERGIADIETTVILKDKAVNDLLAEKGQWGEDTSEYRRLQERYELAKEEKRMLQQEKHDLRAELTSRIQEKTALVQRGASPASSSLLPFPPTLSCPDCFALVWSRVLRCSS